ncbi:MAG: RNA polymerase sigma factor [Thermomicrobiales bacterium]
MARNEPFQKDRARPSRSDTPQVPAAHPTTARPSDTPGVPDDLDLLRHAQRDPLAFAPRYQRYATPVYHYCYRQTSDPDAASDLTAHIFTKALEALPRFRPRSASNIPTANGSTFRSWLFSIAHNTIVDWHRRQRPTIPLDDHSHHVADPDTGPEALAVHQDELGHLIAALDHIPDTHRTIIELRLAGLTSAEIGETLGMSRAAVKSAQTRAYARLRDLLEPQPQPPFGSVDTSSHSTSHPTQEPSR